MLTRKRKHKQLEQVNAKMHPNTNRPWNSKQKPKEHLEDLQQLVTVEKNVCDERGSVLIRHSQINLLSHCVFCLRKTTTISNSSDSSSVNLEDVGSDELIEDVPQAIGCSQFLSTFNSIWNFLGKRKERKEEDPLGILDESEALSKSRKNSTTFLELPRMCVFCAERMRTVHKLLIELRTQLDGIEGVMNDSKYSGKFSRRAEHFERILTTSNLEQEIITATMDVLDKLGRNYDALKMNEPLHDNGVVDKFTVNSEPVSTIIPELPPCSDNQSSSTESDEKYVGPEFPPLTEELPQKESSDPEIQPDGTGSYVDFSNANNDSSGDFIDEDDDWNASDSDPDYIKSEHDEDDFSETTSSDSDDNSASAPRQGGDSKTRIPRDSSVGKRNGVNASGTAVKRRKRDKYKRQRLVQLGQLIVEKDVETGKEKFHCRIDGCNKTFKRFDYFSNHEVKKHRGEVEKATHQCDQCDQSFPLRSSLRKHKWREHNKTGISKGQMCDLCRKSVPLVNMHAHVREHVGDEYFIPCPNPACLSAYVNPHSLYLHLTVHNPRCRKSISNLEEILENAQCIKCLECGYKASTKTALKTHLLRVHENDTKNFSCPIDNCLQQFTCKKSVQFHIVGVHRTALASLRKPVSFQNCSLCNSRFKLNEIKNHLMETHGVGAEEVIKCSHCLFVFSTREHLIEHLFTHKNSVLSCDICGDDDGQVKFSQHIRLREHYFKEHNIGKQFPCEHCNAVFWTRPKWMDHMATRHKKEEVESMVISVPKKKPKLSYKCDDCDAVYSSADIVKDHQIKVHGAEPYRCKICTATFLLRAHLLKHEKEHAGAGTTFPCEVEGCGKSFYGNSKLKHHIATAHQGERPHVCELCGKSYTERHSLAKHKISVHLGLKPHVCDICGESFAVASYLRRHQRIHSEERPYGCEICGQRFRHRESLKGHVQGHQSKGADFKPKGRIKQAPEKSGK